MKSLTTSVYYGKTRLKASKSIKKGDPFTVRSCLKCLSELKHVQVNVAMSAEGRIQSTSTNCYHSRGLLRMGRSKGMYSV